MEGDYGFLWGDARFRWMAILLHIKKNSINKEYMDAQHIAVVVDVYTHATS
jgi:hypothetical protein